MGAVSTRGGEGFGAVMTPMLEDGSRRGREAEASAHIDHAKWQREEERVVAGKVAGRLEAPPQEVKVDDWYGKDESDEVTDAEVPTRSSRRERVPWAGSHGRGRAGPYRLGSGGPRAGPPSRARLWLTAVPVPSLVKSSQV